MRFIEPVVQGFSRLLKASHLVVRLRLPSHVVFSKSSPVPVSNNGFSHEAASGLHPLNSPDRGSNHIYQMSTPSTSGLGRSIASRLQFPPLTTPSTPSQRGGYQGTVGRGLNGYVNINPLEPFLPFSFHFTSTSNLNTNLPLKTLTLFVSPNIKNPTSFQPLFGYYLITKKPRTFLVPSPPPFSHPSTAASRSSTSNNRSETLTLQFKVHELCDPIYYIHPASTSQSVAPHLFEPEAYGTSSHKLGPQRL